MLGCLQHKFKSIKAPGCKKEVFATLKDSVNDFDLSPAIKKACHTDAEKYCKNVPAGDGRKLSCLSAHISEVSKICAKELRSQKEIASTDVRLNPTLVTACKEELQTHCKDAQAGEARRIGCLQEHMGSTEYSTRCKLELAKQVASGLLDYHLDHQLAKACETD